MNALGVCCVPLNADHRPREMAYVLDHAKVDLVIVVNELRPLLQATRGRDAQACAGAARHRTATTPTAVPSHSPRPQPTRPPACSTPRAPPAGPRAACCRTATSWKRAAGTPPRVAWRPLATAPTASTTRCHCSTSTHRSSPSTARCYAATARCRPTDSAPRAGGPRCTSRAPPSCTTWAWWCQCCWGSRRVRRSAAIRCVLPSVPASTRSATPSSSSASASRWWRSGA